MKAIIYLIIMQLKNKILSLKKHPGKLIAYSFLVLMFVGVILISIFATAEDEQLGLTDERILYLVLAGMGFLFLGINLASGLSTGSTLFSMSDVGYLFTAPISPKKILFYGLINTLGKTLLSSIFILYQVVNLRVQFGYGLKEIALLFILYSGILIIGQLLSIALYLFTNGSPRRKRGIKLTAVVALLALALVIFATYIQQGRDLATTAYSIADAKWFGLLPIGGWAIMIFRGVLHGFIGEAVLAIALFLGTGFLVILTLSSGKADYYEDVLVSTELVFKAQKAVKEKKTATFNTNTNKKTRVIKEENTLKGFGAKVIAYKHILEKRRSNKIPFIDSYTIIASIIVGIAGYNMGGDNVSSIFGMFAFLAYMQYFLTMFNPLSMEIARPYIYLIPESSRKKVVAASITSFMKPCIDAVIIFGVFAAVGGANLLSSLLLAIGYATTGTVYVGISILNQRILGGQPNIFIKLLIGMLLFFIVLIPAVFSIVLTAILLPEQYIFFSMLPFSLCCILITFLIYLLAGNVLDKSELD